MRPAVILAALLSAPPAPAGAESALQRAKFENLGLFAGYVVACGIAGETEAEAMATTLRAGLGEPSRQDAAVFDQARATARKSKCPPELRAAVERGWLNYRDAK